MPASDAARNADLTRDLALGAGLVLLVGVAFGRAVSFSFTGYDDPIYVSSNPHVLGGFTAENLRWAFTTFEAGNWHPLTWLTLMVDASIGGANASIYHATNVVLHAAGTLALFLSLRRMTRQPMRSAMVAALFAVHPLHVESVAWVAERKDVLSGLLFFLAIHAYARHAERPGARRMIAVTSLMAAGLLAKPMLVSLPLVLLLLDVWPLRRLEIGRRGWLPPRLVLEKLPLVVLSAASCVITFVAQSAGGAVVSLQKAPLTARLANAIVTVLVYLAKAAWPTHLGVIYPFPLHGTPAWKAVGALVLVLALCWLVLRSRRARPYLAVGWFWYLIMLIPVIGIVQVGVLGRADRYTYLPLVGIFVAATWGIADLLVTRLPAQRARAASIAAAAVVLAALLVGCLAQVSHWRDRLTLFQHLVEVVPDYPNAHLTVGAELDQRRDFAGSKASYERALAIDPDSADAHSNLAFWYLRDGAFDRALVHASEVVRLRPELFEGHLARARALGGLGRHEAAIESFRRVLSLNPELKEARSGLGSELLWAGRTDEALEVLRRAVEEAPGEPRLRHDLAVALLRQQRLAEAVQQFEAARALAPKDVQILTNLANTLLDLGRVDEAGARYQEALKADPGAVDAHFGWGVVLAHRGDRAGAVREFQLVLRAKPGNGPARQNLELLGASREQAPLVQ